MGTPRMLMARARRCGPAARVMIAGPAGSSMPPPGVPQPAVIGDEPVIEVVTSCDRVPVLLHGREAVSLQMVMRGPGEVFHVCKGDRFLEPDGTRGERCGCPMSLADRRSVAQAGRGPAPEVRIEFRLADRPDMGVFFFLSNSWELADEVPALIDALDQAAAPMLGVLRCELLHFTTGSGLVVSYRRPVVEIGRGQVLARGAMRLAV
ncbi:hypothetical protein ACGFY8_35025 [Streptomyces sp. NPDC048232]|uniref:recombination directionality factor n=1 Tax=Streptomyces sp. NPDC048232 TaxID=3365520 RepID=UPI003722E389